MTKLAGTIQAQTTNTVPRARLAQDRASGRQPARSPLQLQGRRQESCPLYGLSGPPEAPAYLGASMWVLKGGGIFWKGSCLRNVGSFGFGLPVSSFMVPLGGRVTASAASVLLGPGPAFPPPVTDRPPSPTTASFRLKSAFPLSPFWSLVQRLCSRQLTVSTVGLYRLPSAL